MKRVAVLLDLGHVLYKLYPLLGKRTATPDEVVGFAKNCLAGEEELFRVYCYHCPPYGKTHPTPLSGKAVNFRNTDTYKTMDALISELEVRDGIAFRAGEILFNGWKLKAAAAQELLKGARPLADDDFQPDMEQKRVDIKIGLDVAWLASKQIVDRVILATADSDFVPAMKFARREGIQVVIATVGDHGLRRDLKVHADEVRSIPFPSTA